MSDTRTMIVDDQADVRVLVRMTIELADEGVYVGCEAANGFDALARWPDCRPDVVVLDERMPRMSGLETAAALLDMRPDQPIVLFSAHLTPELRASAAELGISACVAKDDLNDLVPALRRAVHA